MVCIPWVELKKTLSQLGHFPLLGWPNDVDPYTCIFTWQKDKAMAVRSDVFIVEWSPFHKEWMDLR